MVETPTPLALSGETAGRLAAEKPDARRTERGTGRGPGTDNKTAALRSIQRAPRDVRAARNTKPTTEEKPMSDRTDYAAMAEKIDYTKLEKKLEQLRQQEPPKKRKGIADVLGPIREKLIELHAAGWTYPRLVEELNSAGMAIKLGTLREYLGNGGHNGKRRATRARRNRRTASATSGGH